MYELTEYEVEQRISGLGLEAAAGQPVGCGLIPEDKAKELLRKVSGRLVCDGDPGYEELRKIFYPNFHDIRPGAIGVCKTVSDVRAFLDCIRETRIPWVPRSGGHSTAGYSTIPRGLMLDLRSIDSCYVDLAREVVHTGPGTQFRDLYRTLDVYGRIVPAGICPEVNVGGHMQGGGYGFASRMFGMNCDAAMEMEVVLANGRVVVANESHNADLFWALRGGTGNNFGIVTRVTYKLHRLEKVGGVKLTWRLQTAEEIQRGAEMLNVLQQRYMASNDDRRLGYMAFLQFFKKNAKPVLHAEIRALYRDTEDWHELLEGVLAIPGYTQETYPMGPYYQLNNDVMEIKKPQLSPFIELMTDAILEPQEKQTRFFDRPLGVEGWRQMIQYLWTWDEMELTRLPLVNIEPGGGAIDDVPRGGNAYIHRKSDFNAFVNVHWQTQEQRKKALAFLDGWLELTAPWSNGEGYQNYPKPYYKNWSDLYWKEYYPLLCCIKEKYDPAKLFNFEQAIGADGNCPKDNLDEIEKLSPEIVKALREPIRYEE